LTREVIRALDVADDGCIRTREELMSDRRASISRKTNETDIQLVLNLDGTGQSSVSTGIGFFDHMLQSLSRHSAMDLALTCKGDVHIDDHHTVEDCAIVLGQAFEKALGDKTGIARFGSACAPLDEALARAVVDLCGRPCAVIDLQLDDSMLGTMTARNLEHVLESFAVNARMTLHVDVLRGKNNHHRAEAAFKALALAIRSAIRITGTGIPSTKGVL